VILVKRRIRDHSPVSSTSSFFSPHPSHPDPDPDPKKMSSTAIKVVNIGDLITTNILMQQFGVFGEIVKVAVPVDQTGKKK